MAKTHSIGRDVAKIHDRAGGGLTATFGNGQECVVRVYAGTYWLEGGRLSRRREVRSHTFAEHVAQAVADCRALGGGWRILSLSAPTTIYRDLTGRRSDQSPESIMVPRADHDILAPHLVGRSDKPERERRKAAAS